MRTPLFTGCATAIITPFTETGIDLPALECLTLRQIQSGVDALVVCGTTGEASTMTQRERTAAIETVARCAGGRVPVIAGAGSNCTEKAAALCHDAVSAGADGLLLVTPYYNKASPGGLVRHYRTLADQAERPVILYNVPGRTGVRCTAETYQALADHPNIQGVKEASGDLALVQRTRELCPGDFFLWSGNDDETAPIMLLGGVGVISVASNVVPEEMVRLTHACLGGDFAAAGRLQLRLRKLCAALFREVNPIPVKTALAMMGQCREIFRLPLCPMEPAAREELRSVLETYGLIEAV